MIPNRLPEPYHIRSRLPAPLAVFCGRLKSRNPQCTAVLLAARTVIQTTMSNPEPPPTYSQEDSSGLSSCPTPPLQPQILIVPTTSALGFQKGYLGADGERAAIEGELQVKGSSAGRWGRVCVCSVVCQLVG